MHSLEVVMGFIWGLFGVGVGGGVRGLVLGFQLSSTQGSNK